MAQTHNNKRRYEDDDKNSNQTIRLVKDVKDEDTNETHEVDVLADFKGSKKEVKNDSPEEKVNKDKELDEKTKKMRVVEVESHEDDYVPFEPTRELKVQRGSSYHDNDDYKERVLVNSSENSVGVKKIIVGEETTTLPVYQRPKKDPQTIIRDIFIYLLMVAIVSILVILLLKYCNDAKNDDREIIDRTASSYTTTEYKSKVVNTETTTTTSSSVVGTETTTVMVSKKPTYEIPSSKTTKKSSTSTTTKKTTTTEKPTEKPTDPVEQEPTTDPATEEPTDPIAPDDSNNANEQG